MSIKSTQEITLEAAIERIKYMAELIHDKNYREIKEASFESNHDVLDFVIENYSIDVSDIDKWTDKMLEDKMDEPFFRWSLFDNYWIVEEKS